MTVSTLQQREWTRYAGKPGEKNHQARLDAGKVLRIRKLYSDGVSDTAIASYFGIARGSVWDAATGRTWSHI